MAWNETSGISRMEYKLNSRTLKVWFAEGGRKRVFTGVPPDLFERLLSAPKKAAFFEEHIRDRFAA